MVNYFYGEDTWAARQALDELAQGASARLRFVDRDELESGLAVLTAGASLFGRVLPVVRDATQLPAELQRAVAAAAGETTGLCVLWDRGAPDRRSVLWRQFGKLAREFAAPDARALSGWVQAAARERGVAVSPQQATHLAAATGGDRWQMLQELDKAAAAGSLTVERHGVGESEDVFFVLDALVAGRTQAAVAGVQALLAAGHSEFYILSMLAYQFRTLLVVRSGLDAGLQHMAIVREGRVKSYAVQKNMPAARQRSAAFWQEALTRVLATDTAIRAGMVEARTGLLMLVGGLMAARGNS